MALYDVATCGAVCTSYKPHLFVTNGSRSWRELTPPHMLYELEDVYFSTRLTGWVAANDCAAGKAFVYRTIDGGRRWRAVAVRATNCSAGSRLDLSFSDNKHGWILDVYGNGNAPYPVERTLDAGATWKETGGVPLAGSISFRTSRDGWLARSDFADQQQLYSTRDGGQTWRRRVLPRPRGWSGARLFPDTPRFFGRRGVLPASLTRRNQEAVAFYVTGNGGRTWRLRSVRPVASSTLAPTNPFVRYVPTSIVNPNVWWIAAGRTRPLVAVTTDAGKSWRVSVPSSLTGTTASEISATDARHGWLTTSGVNNRAAYTTRDGGRTWHRLSLPGA